MPSNALILDEAHYISKKSKRSVTGLSIASQADYILLLTGTMITNRPIDLWNQLVAIRHKIAEKMTRTAFSRRYCGGHLKQIYRRGGRKMFVWWEGGATNIDELASRLKSAQGVLIEKTEGNVDLPKLVVSERLIDLSPTYEKEYKVAYKKYLQWLKDNPEITEQKLENVKNARQLVEVGKLRQVTSKAKVEQFLEDVQNIDEPFVVFAGYTESINAINAGLKKLGISYSTIKEDENADKFINGEVTGFTANIKAGGTGLNLQRARRLFIIDEDWTPAVNSQAIKRIHRIGQDRTSFVVFYRCADTVDIDLKKNNENKNNVIDRIVSYALDF